MTAHTVITFTRCRSATPPCLAEAPYLSDDTAWLLASHIAVLLPTLTGYVRDELEGFCNGLARALDDPHEPAMREMEKSGPVAKVRPDQRGSVHDRTLKEILAEEARR